MKLGDKVRDRITGFEGIATSVTTYVNGCVRYGVQPQALDKDGKPAEPQYFDIEQLQVVQKVMEPKKSTAGGPGAIPRGLPNPR